MSDADSPGLVEICPTIQKERLVRVYIEYYIVMIWFYVAMRSVLTEGRSLHAVSLISGVA